MGNGGSNGSGRRRHRSHSPPENPSPAPAPQRPPPESTMNRFVYAAATPYPSQYSNPNPPPYLHYPLYYPPPPMPSLYQHQFRVNWGVLRGPRPRELGQRRAAAPLPGLGDSPARRILHGSSEGGDDSERCQCEEGELEGRAR